MKPRISFVAAATAAALVVLGIGPAYAAAPDAPGVDGLDAGTAGHVVGTVTSDQAFVLVGLTGTPTDAVDTSSGTGTFDLETWGFPAAANVHAYACPTDTFVADDCSPATVSDPFDPSDASPTVTWSADPTLGPGQAAGIEVADPQGGGDLRVRWDNSEGDDTDAAVDRNGTTALPLADGTGTATLVRCAAGSTTRCVTLPGVATQGYEVRTTISAAVTGGITTLTPVHGTTAVTVDTNRAGAYSLTWELRDPSTNTPVPTFSGTASGDLDSLGTAPPFTIDGAGLPDGSYDVVVSISVTDPDFGPFPAQSATGTVHSTQTLPTVTPTIGTISPIVPGHPTSTAVVDTDRTGTYSLEWELRVPGSDTAVPDFAGNASGTLSPTGAAAPFSISGVGLSSGDYDVVVTLTVTDPDPEVGALAPVEVVGSLHVDLSLGVQIGALTAITEAHPSTSVAVTTGHAGGDYSLTWALRDTADNLVLDSGPAAVEGPLSATGAAAPFSLSGLPDGEYTLTVTITVTDDDFGDLGPVVVEKPLTVDRIAPVVTATGSASQIFPNVANATRPGTVTFTLAGAGLGEVAAVRMRSGTTTLAVARSGSKVTWNGKSGSTVMPGTFTLIAVDALGNEQVTTGKVTVFPQRLVLKTYRASLTARGSKIGQFVGKCSTLRSPSLRKWSGSLGFYANSRCKRTDWTSSASSTVHRAVLPVAERYVDVRVSAFGGAAKKAKRSRALLRYLSAAGAWSAETTMASKIGTHAGPTRSLSGMTAGRSFYWGFATSSQNQYDVRGFTVVARYYVLG